MQFVPFYNTLAGMTLTPIQWQETGVKSIAFDLGILLQRPGIESLTSLKKYTRGPGKIIIDARAIEPNKNQEIDFRTPDGAKHKISLLQLDSWLSVLDADEIIVNEKLTLEKNNEKLVTMSDALKNYYISDEPASLAIQGVVIRGLEPTFNILDESFSNFHQILVKNCDCMTCQSGFTCSYLHHLLQHTPLLAQRFLVQHNIYQVCKSMSE